MKNDSWFTDLVSQCLWASERLLYNDVRLLPLPLGLVRFTVNLSELDGIELV